MNEYQRKKQLNDQLERNLKRDINEFLTNGYYSDIKELYKNNFDTIVSYINKTNPKSATEDIANIDSTLSDKIMSNIVFLKEINKAIKDEKLTKEKL